MDTTLGDFTPADFEALLHRAHRAYKGYPSCAMDRWSDNHYGIDLLGWNADGFMKYILEKLGTDEEILYTCDGHPQQAPGGIPGAHLVFDPTGWGVEIHAETTTMLPGCSRSRDELRGSGDDVFFWCKSGIFEGACPQAARLVV